MTDQVRVLVYDGPHRMHVESRAAAVPATGQVRLRLAYVGICGSDLHGYTGESGRRAPGMVMGHEASGWVEAIGDGVTGWSIGDPVTFNPAIPCDGSCGHTSSNRCAQLRVVGVTPDIQGAFADSIVVDATRVVALGSLDLVSGAMVEPLAVAIQTANRCDIQPGQSVVIIGGGMIGQCVAHAARLAGADPIVVSEAMPARRQMAADGGFVAIEPDAVAGLDLVDCAIDAVGVDATAAAAIRAVKKGGTVGFVGLGLAEVTIPLFDVVVPERTIVGSFCYSDEVFSAAVDHLAAGRVDLANLVGSLEEFEDIAAGFEALASGERTDAKILMATGATRPGTA